MPSLVDCPGSSVGLCLCKEFCCLLFASAGAADKMSAAPLSLSAEAPMGAEGNGGPVLPPPTLAEVPISQINHARLPCNRRTGERGAHLCLWIP